MHSYNLAQEEYKVNHTFWKSKNPILK